MKALDDLAIVKSVAQAAVIKAWPASRPAFQSNSIVITAVSRYKLLVCNGTVTLIHSSSTMMAEERINNDWHEPRLKWHKREGD